MIFIEGVGTSDGFEDLAWGDREELICYFQNGQRQYRNLTNPVSFIPAHLCYPELAVADVSRTDPQVSIYPNPARSGLQITAKGSSQIDPHFYLSDLAGRIVFNGNGHKEGKTITCDLSDVPNGLYLLKFRAGDAFYYRKIIVQH